MPEGALQEILIVRHGESAGNVARDEADRRGAEIIAVDEDDRAVALSPRGIEQARALGMWLAQRPPSEIWTSPHRRASETARIVSEQWTQPVPIVVDERLRERSLGVLNRLTAAGVRARYPQEAAERTRIGKFYYRPPLGESWADVIERLKSVVDALRTTRASSVAIITHQAVVLCLRFLLERLTPEQLMAVDAQADIANCSITRYRGRNGDYELIDFNDVTPLAAMDAPVTKANDAADVR